MESVSAKLMLCCCFRSLVACRAGCTACCQYHFGIQIQSLWEDGGYWVRSCSLMLSVSSGLNLGGIKIVENSIAIMRWLQVTILKYSGKAAFFLNFVSSSVNWGMVRFYWVHIPGRNTRVFLPTFCLLPLTSSSFFSSIILVMCYR